MSDYMPVPRSQLAVRACPSCGGAVTAALGVGGSVVLHDDPPQRRGKRGHVWVAHVCPPPPPAPPELTTVEPPTLFGP